MAVDSKTARELGSEPVAWRTQADSLRHAASILWDRALSAEIAMSGNELANDEYLKLIDEYGLVDAAMMLDGLALENLVKARLIETKPWLVERDRISTDLLNHGLAKLFHLADIVVDAQEASVITRLEHLITWAARYPTPSRFRRSASGVEQIRSSLPSADRPVIDRLLDKFS